jgi:hypothetical protein
MISRSESINLRGDHATLMLQALFFPLLLLSRIQDTVMPGASLSSHRRLRSWCRFPEFLKQI